MCQIRNAGAPVVRKSVTRRDRAGQGAALPASPRIVIPVKTGIQRGAGVTQDAATGSVPRVARIARMCVYFKSGGEIAGSGRIGGEKWRRRVEGLGRGWDWMGLGWERMAQEGDTFFGVRRREWAGDGRGWTVGVCVGASPCGFRLGGRNDGRGEGRGGRDFLESRSLSSY